MLRPGSRFYLESVEFDAGRHHRAKLGFILMSTDLAAEADFYDMAPQQDGITVTTSQSKSGLVRPGSACVAKIGQRYTLHGCAYLLIQQPSPGQCHYVAEDRLPFRPEARCPDRQRRDDLVARIVYKQSQSAILDVSTDNQKGFKASFGFWKIIAISLPRMPRMTRSIFFCQPRLSL